jgi:hypothetical protein
MLMANPDPLKREYWRQLMFSPTSYFQHGGNAVMVLGEIVLGRLPVWASLAGGCVAIWANLYGLWSLVRFIHTGTFIYPFLDAHQPYAWVVYVGLFVVHWAFTLLVVGLVAAREGLLKRHAVRKQR